VALALALRLPALALRVPALALRLPALALRVSLPALVARGLAKKQPVRAARPRAAGQSFGAPETRPSAAPPLHCAKPRAGTAASLRFAGTQR
jgi:hypothetical protein